MQKLMLLLSWPNLTNPVWVLLCSLLTLHVSTVQNLYTKAVSVVFFIATLIAILVGLRSWKSQESK
jgi:hypothetical protein